MTSVLPINRSKITDLSIPAYHAVIRSELISFAGITAPHLIAVIDISQLGNITILVFSTPVWSHPIDATSVSLPDDTDISVIW
jgi:hypothetical protein